LNPSYLFVEAMSSPMIIDHPGVRAYARGGYASRPKRYRSAFSGASKSYNMRMVRYYRRKANIRSAGYLGIEHKFLDTAQAAFTIPNNTTQVGGEANPDSGCAGCLSAPAVGTGEQQRVGRKICIKSIYANCVVSMGAVGDAADIGTGPYVMVALVLDTQTNAATLNSEDVFTNPGADAALCAFPQRDLEFSGRFKVLARKVFHMPINAAATDGTNTNTTTPQPRYVRLKYKWKKGLIVHFNATNDNADVADVVDNSLHIIAFKSFQAANDTTLSYNCRIRYTDN